MPDATMPCLLPAADLDAASWQWGRSAELIALSVLPRVLNFVGFCDRGLFLSPSLQARFGFDPKTGEQVEVR